MKIGRNKLIKSFFIRESDFNSLELYLEQMASKGWILDSISPILRFLQFKKCEPKQVKFYVDIFEEYSKFTGTSSYNLPEYIGMCEESGWKHICEIPPLKSVDDLQCSFQIFMSDDLDTPPIQTNDFFKIEPILKASMNMLILGTLFFIIYFYNIFIKSSTNMELLYSYYFSFFVASIHVISYGLETFIWQFRAKKSMLNALPIRYTSLKSLKIRSTIQNLLILLIAVCFLFVFLLTSVDFYNHSFMIGTLIILYIAIFALNVIYIAEIIRENIVSIDKIN